MPVPDDSYDVVVLGSGAGGMSAALTAAINGLSVAIFEKTGLIGGSTAVSGGAVWIPDNGMMAGLGIEDSRERALGYLQAVVGNRLRRDMVDAFLAEGPPMLDFFARHSEVRFQARPVSPDYHSETEGAAMGGRTLDPVPFDGSALGCKFQHLRAPFSSFMVVGGMMVNTKDIQALLGAFRDPRMFHHSSKLLLRHFRDRLVAHRGRRLLLGNALAARLYKSALDRNIPIFTNAVASDLLVDGAGVGGAVFAMDGASRHVRAARGIVLATGGFPGSPDLRARHMPHAAVHITVAPVSNCGDGLRLAQKVGGTVETGNKGAGLWTPVSVMKRPDGTEEYFPHLILDRAKPGLIAIDADGRRFVNEAVSYHEFVEAMHASEKAVPAFLVCDSQFLGKYGLGLVRPKYSRSSTFVRAGYLISAPTVESLADRLDVDRSNLLDAVAGMNEAAKTGLDAAFGKGASRYNRYLGDPDHRPNPCLGPIRTAPFHAVKVWPGDIGTAAGLRTDARARVLDGNDRPIAGLYACGNDMASIMAGSYPAAGITLGPALTFGYIAGTDLAKQPQYDRPPGS